MTVQVFTLHSNGSSRNTIAWLNEKGIAHTEIRMNNHPPTKEQLKHILSLTLLGTDEILAKTSKAYKTLVAEGIDFEEVTLSELCYIVKKHPTIMKAPIVVTDKKLVVGYQVDRLTALFPRYQRLATMSKLLDVVRQEEDTRINNGELVGTGGWSWDRG